MTTAVCQAGPIQRSAAPNATEPFRLSASKYRALGNRRQLFVDKMSTIAIVTPGELKIPRRANIDGSVHAGAGAHLEQQVLQSSEDGIYRRRNKHDRNERHQDRDDKHDHAP